jgi:N-acetylneuraminate synthase
MDGDSCFIIAEAGVNHNGSFDLAVQLIYAAKKAGADAVKFQTFRTKDLVTCKTPGATYQEKNLGYATTQQEMLRKLELTHDEFRLLAVHAEALGILFLSTPFDPVSADFLAELDLPFYKIGSGELTHHALLRHVARKGSPVILSTGMADLNEVRAAVEVVRSENAELILLHCVSNYPAAPCDVNLRAMQTLADEFQVPVGFSDHTQGIHISLAAVALGASVIEKHFTLSRTMEGPDHKASLEPAEFRQMVHAIRDIEAAMGSGIKEPATSEKHVAEAARRSWVAAQNLEKGTILTPGNLLLRRPGTGLPESQLSRLLGRSMSCAAQEGEVLQLSHLQEAL